MIISFTIQFLTSVIMKPYNEEFDFMEVVIPSSNPFLFGIFIKVSLLCIQEYYYLFFTLYIIESKVRAEKPCKCYYNFKAVVLMIF
jgi:hypothetical protein